MFKRIGICLCVKLAGANGSEKRILADANVGMHYTAYPYKGERILAIANIGIPKTAYPYTGECNVATTNLENDNEEEDNLENDNEEEEDNLETEHGRRRFVRIRR